MRGNILRGAYSRMNGQLYALFHRNDAWPKMLVLVIALFYVTIFALFALSYTYIFSGLWGGSNVPLRMVGDSTSMNILNDTASLPQNITASFDTNSSPSINNNTSPAPTSHTTVQVNGNTVPVPKSGFVHKEISTDNGNASIDVNLQSNGSVSSTSSSSIDLSINSSSYTVDGGQQ